MSSDRTATTGKGRTRRKLPGIITSLSFLLVGGMSFYMGISVGTQIGLSEGKRQCLKHVSSVMEELKKTKNEPQADLTPKEATVADKKKEPRFPERLSKIVSGMAVLDRDGFAKRFDMGVPLDKSTNGNRDVLLLYTNERSFPSNSTHKNLVKSNTDIPRLTVDEATRNCDYLHIILNQPDPTRAQCLALFGQYESYHIQRFMRLPPTNPNPRAKSDPLSRDAPLRYVNRGAQRSGRLSYRPPTKEMTMLYWQILKEYLSVFSDAIARLQVITNDIKQTSKTDTIIVMVCNHGQADLLLNWACGANARGLDTSMTLVFATDAETRDLALGLGLRVYYDRDVFQDVPKRAARAYADQTFMKLMLVKLISVQMTLMTQSNVIFQDVDTVWYDHPLSFFNNATLSGDFDIYFQDDGNHAEYYAPYSANTGFYFVRYNDRTQYFFNSYLVNGDQIIDTRSHQIPCVAMLAEHASMYGLKIKIFNRNGDEFPGGFAFHNRRDYMKRLFAGQVDPYIFHMSWTKNKDNKMKFLQQMGEWYLDDRRCSMKTVRDIGSSDVKSACCQPEAKVTCHYRDKPSKTPCKDAPSIDANGRSFW